MSSILLPVTVVKARYESGQYHYSSLTRALKDAYAKNGWVGIAPTVFRDSLFSGIYLACYTELRNADYSTRVDRTSLRSSSTVNFFNGVISGFIASVITNPIDVLKTNIQAGSTGETSMFRMATNIRGQNGYIRFLDGVVPRTIRRTLLSATTWTIYECLNDLK